MNQEQYLKKKMGFWSLTALSLGGIIDQAGILTLEYRKNGWTCRHYVYVFATLLIYGQTGAEFSLLFGDLDLQDI